MGGSIASHFVGLPGGLLMSLIAFSIVFLVIMGLMLMMMALKVFAGAMDGGQKAKAAPAATSAPAAPAAKSGMSAAVSVAASQDDDELIAVIAAAVSAACGRAARVVSFKPATVTGASAWRMTGILQNSEGFLD